ncbi:MAG: ROK family protein [Candidatus Acidiferrales bacterium]
MKALAIDLGGTHATCAIIEDSKILFSRHLDLDSAQGLGTVLPLFASTFRDLLSAANLRTKDFAGMAVSTCGLVDSVNVRILSSPKKWDDAPGVDFVGWCRQEFSLPLKMENDARMALMGERYAGVGRGCNDLAMITLGTGIGTAVMIGGTLLHGKHFQAGNLGGHQPVVFNGRDCTCGGIGCAEAEGAGWALPLIAKDWPGFSESALAGEPAVNFEALFRLANDGDPVATQLRERCLRVWAATAVGIIHAFDPDVVIFGGGVLKSAEMIIPFVQTHVNAHTWSPWGKAQIRAAALGNNAGLLGAVPLLTAR